MKVLEIRRHSERHKPGQHLNQAGVSLARRLGADMGPFHFVIASTVPRAIETAIAMGFATDGEEDLWAELGGAVDKEMDWQAGFAKIGAAVRTGLATGALAKRLRGFCEDVLSRLPDGKAALIVTHGGLVEIAATACFPDADHTSWGGPAGLCEGVRLVHDGHQFRLAEIIRVTPPVKTA